MKELIINGHVITSIWKSDKASTDITNNENQNIARNRQAYRDPTANTAIGNILREERKAKKKKQQQTANHKRQN